ncbi:hypothetical protein OV090_12250 [Nannocystis sp. RBIL2]|uniref:hypothetical protein n=1 Tax=Nannocystis sp. RBIL2 TaxID=2996788 RepID=UPI00226F5819|nr:hypothetical protein [Nannocystis sp. RBIL2]MCY1065542.1 hypothetical protein [Nannocystis sp. RBIL2]
MLPRSRTHLILVALLLLPLACTERPKGDSATEPATAGTTDTAPTSTMGASTTGQMPQPTSTDATTTTTTSGPDATTGPATGPVTDAATDPTTGDPTTVDPVTSTTSTDATTDAPGTTDAPPDEKCDIWTQDCPEGQKCMPVSLDGVRGNEAARCRPVVDDPDALGERCTVLGTSGEGLDTCPEGQFCWRNNIGKAFGTCLALCTGSPEDPTCAEPGLVCEHFHAITNLCVRHCDPLAQDCPGDDLCVPDDVGDDQAFMCLDDASGAKGQTFDSCTESNTCDAGLKCGSPFMIPECKGDPEGGCCLPYCDLTADPDVCLDIGLQCLQELQGDVPPGLEDVGVCGRPPW